MRRGCSGNETHWGKGWQRSRGGKASRERKRGGYSPCACRLTRIVELFILSFSILAPNALMEPIPRSRGEPPLRPFRATRIQALPTGKGNWFYGSRLLSRVEILGECRGAIVLGTASTIHSIRKLTRIQYTHHPDSNAEGIRESDRLYFTAYHPGRQA